MSKHDSLKLSSKGSVELMYYQTEPSLRQTMKNQRKKNNCPWSLHQLTTEILGDTIFIV